MTEKELVEAAKALKELQDNMPHILEHLDFEAKVKRAKFRALVREGFSDAQALELCK